VDPEGSPSWKFRFPPPRLITVGDFSLPEEIRIGSFDRDDTGPDEEGFYNRIVLQPQEEIRIGSFGGDDTGPDEEGFYYRIVLQPQEGKAHMHVLSASQTSSEEMEQRARANVRVTSGTEVGADTNMEQAQPEVMVMKAKTGRRAKWTIEDSDDEEALEDVQEESVKVDKGNLE